MVAFLKQFFQMCDCQKCGTLKAVRCATRSQILEVALMEVPHLKWGTSISGPFHLVNFTKISLIIVAGLH